MKPEKRMLLDDVLGQSRREATLLAGGKILRRRRWQRAAARSLAVLAVAVLAAVAIHQKRPVQVVAQSGPARPGPQPVHVQYLTDEQLLAYFPNTPIGLITTANGRKALIFPHPGDEEKFIIRL
jgi:hypothetical protein